MILSLDVGNTQIYGGVFESEKPNSKMLASFRKNSSQGSSSDDIGIFLRSALRENGIDYKQIKKIAFCSVVPEVVYSLKGACQKYFGIKPFILQAGVKTGLKIKYKNPLEVGADRIANAIAATYLYPQKNLIIIDLGTATTFCVVTATKEYFGGVIISGLRLNMEALESKTAKLPSVEIVAKNEVLGKSTVDSLQSGLYYGHLGSMKEITKVLVKECFGNEPYTVIGTGGFSTLFEKEKIFDVVMFDLVLQGNLIALSLNQDNEQ